MSGMSVHILSCSACSNKLSASVGRTRCLWVNRHFTQSATAFMRDSSTYSAGSRRKNRSMAAEKAAKARPPPNTPVGPEFRARIPPATNPAATGLTMSFRARYCCEIERQRLPMDVKCSLTDSMTHSIPANKVPTLANPFPLLHIPRPISLNISFVFCVVFKFCRRRGSSYAKEEDIMEKNPPMANP